MTSNDKPFQSGESPTNDRGSLTRRGVLATTGAGAFALAGFSSVASAVPSKGAVVRLKGTWDRPVTSGAIRDAMDHLFSRYTGRGGTLPDDIPMADLDADYGAVDEEGVEHRTGRTVEAVVGLRPDGVPRLFRHVVGTPDDSLEKARAAGSRKVDEFGAVADDSVSTQDAPDPDKEWKFVLDDQNSYQLKPYGIVYNNCEWWQVKNEYDDPGERVHLLRQIAAQEPGQIQDGWNSTYHNEWRECDHKWSDANFDISGIHDIDPANPDDSYEINVSLGYATQGGGTASVNWTFTNDGCIKKISTAGQDVHWEQHCLYSADRRSRIQIEPGSVTVMSDSRNNSCSEFATVTNYRNTGHFENDLLQKAYVWSEAGFGYGSYC